MYVDRSLALDKTVLGIAVVVVTPSIDVCQSVGAMVLKGSAVVLEVVAVTLTCLTVVDEFVVSIASAEMTLVTKVDVAHPLVSVEQLLLIFENTKHQSQYNCCYWYVYQTFVPRTGLVDTTSDTKLCLSYRQIVKREQFTFFNNSVLIRELGHMCQT